MSGICIDRRMTEFDRFDRSRGPNHTARTIDGKTVGISKCVAFCTCDLHPGYVTHELRQRHDCLGKSCFYYVPKPKREKRESDGGEYRLEMEILKNAKKLTEEYEGMKVLGVLSLRNDGCTLRYASISADYPIEKVEKNLSELFGFSVKLHKIDCDYETATELIFQ